jgi:glycosyltransferase involved in cell wall biosynthesis
MHTPPSGFAAMPKALFLSPEAPYPTVGGGPLRSASLLEYLAQCFAVHAVVFREPGSPDPVRAFPPGRVERVDVLELPFHSKRPIARAFRNASRLARRSPPLVDRFSGFEARLGELLDGNAYEVAVIEHFWCAPYVRQLRPHAPRVVLDLHNIESLWHASLAVRESAMRAFALQRFAAAARQLECKWLSEFDSILVTSAVDARKLREIVNFPTVTVYPNALPRIPQPPRSEREEIVFSGNLEYQPNLEAVCFFRDAVWPLLNSRPGLKWRIIGKNPEAVRDLVAGDHRIQLTGFVGDAVTALAQSKVAVVPVLSGSGTRVKILEAWAAGTAVVATPVGAEGLDFQDGEHLLLADTPARFAEAISRLLDSPGERARIGAAGRKCYEQCYTWPVAWESLRGVFGNCAASQ